MARRKRPDYGLDAPGVVRNLAREIARVLKPGGLAVIDDIMYLTEYNAIFVQNACVPVRRLDSRLASFFCPW
jgi:SAM-dependent methyltransferase